MKGILFLKLMPKRQQQSDKIFKTTPFTLSMALLAMLALGKNFISVTGQEVKILFTLRIQAQH